MNRFSDEASKTASRTDRVVSKAALRAKCWKQSDGMSRGRNRHVRDVGSRRWRYKCRGARESIIEGVSSMLERLILGSWPSFQLSVDTCLALAFDAVSRTQMASKISHLCRISCNGPSVENLHLGFTWACSCTICYRALTCSGQKEKILESKFTLNDL